MGWFIEHRPAIGLERLWWRGDRSDGTSRGYSPELDQAERFPTRGTAAAAFFHDGELDGCCRPVEVPDA